MCTLIYIYIYMCVYVYIYMPICTSATFLTTPLSTVFSFNMYHRCKLTKNNNDYT